jgi:hypothetical protein
MRKRRLTLASSDDAVRQTEAIDLLHFARALLLEAEVFLTFDERQFELATAEALEAPALRAAD